MGLLLLHFVLDRNVRLFLPSGTTQRQNDRCHKHFGECLKFVVIALTHHRWQNTRFFLAAAATNPPPPLVLPSSSYVSFDLFPWTHHVRGRMVKVEHTADIFRWEFVFLVSQRAKSHGFWRHDTTINICPTLRKLHVKELSTQHHNTIYDNPEQYKLLGHYTSLHRGPNAQKKIDIKNARSVQLRNASII